MEKKDAKELLVKRILKWRKHRYQAQKRWSAAHHACLFGSILFSVSAGAIIQVWETQTSLAAIFTSIAAVLTSIAASGGFERKWRSNRLSRSKGDLLLIDLEKEDADLDKARKKFKSAIKKHDMDVLGDEPEKEPPVQQEE